MKSPSLEQLRCYAIARSLFTPTTLSKAIARLGFVQADPIRAPARAQDLILRHRVSNYRAGDLERRYAQLPIEEDFFVNYGFVPRAIHQLMHPRIARTEWSQERQGQAEDILEFVRNNGVTHPREIDLVFQHGKSSNWFGGTGKASTQLLDDMHYRGLVRVAGRVGGTRLYQAREQSCTTLDPQAAIDALVDIIVGQYAPLPERSLSELLSYLFRGGVPQWREQRALALTRSKKRMPSAQAAGHTWYWPAGESASSKRYRNDEELRLLAPFDPIVWDRRRFELFWGWAYRFEAYTPAAKRIRGYYALPILWRNEMLGWCNIKLLENRLEAKPGFISGKAPNDPSFRSAWSREMLAMERFLAIDNH